MSVSNSIVANNGGGNCSGSFIDGNYNLESGTDCGFTGTGDHQITDPLLDPNGLQDNGGPTPTIALQSTGSAIDQIPTSACAVTTDQRGVSRPQGSACDIGAFEATAADQIRVLTHVVNSFSPSMGLQTSLNAKLTAALNAVNAGDRDSLTAFINQDNALSGKGLTVNQANQLVAEATNIQQVLH